MPHHLGIRGKLNLGLAVVLLAVTGAFGVAYALLERATVLDLEREHLLHMATLARLYVADARDRHELDAVVNEFNRKLSSSRETPHRLIVKDARGEVLATSDSGSTPSSTLDEASIADPLSLVEKMPAALRVELGVRPGRYVSDPGTRPPAQLALYESVPRLQGMFRASLLRHLEFGVGLVGLAMLAAGILAHRLVVRPVRELAAATDKIAQQDSWEPIAPEERRHDEIGALQNHIAEMSRRLVTAVREERYGSAHLVVERVRRELDEPLRRAAMQLKALEAVLPPGSGVDRARREIAAALEEIAEISRSLQMLPASPPR